MTDTLQTFPLGLKEATELLIEAIDFNLSAAGKDIKHYHYAREFDLINKIVLGCSSRQLRKDSGFGMSCPLRDLLTDGEIKAIAHLRHINGSLICIEWPRKKRKKQLQKMFRERHQQALIDEAQEMLV